jgi:hypothetical protein
MGAMPLLRLRQNCGKLHHTRGSLWPKKMNYSKVVSHSMP